MWPAFLQFKGKYRNKIKFLNLWGKSSVSRHSAVCVCAVAHLLAAGTLLLVSLSAVFPNDAVCKNQEAPMTTQDAKVPQESPRRRWNLLNWEGEEDAHISGLRCHCEDRTQNVHVLLHKHLTGRHISRITRRNENSCVMKSPFYSSEHKGERKGPEMEPWGIPPHWPFSHAVTGERWKTKVTDQTCNAYCALSLLSGDDKGLSVLTMNLLMLLQLLNFR